MVGFSRNEAMSLLKKYRKLSKVDRYDICHVHCQNFFDRVMSINIFILVCVHRGLVNPNCHHNLRLAIALVLIILQSTILPDHNNSGIGLVASVVITIMRAIILSRNIEEDLHTLNSNSDDNVYLDVILNLLYLTHFCFAKNHPSTVDMLHLKMLRDYPFTTIMLHDYGKQTIGVVTHTPRWSTNYRRRWRGTWWMERLYKQFSATTKATYMIQWR